MREITQSSPKKDAVVDFSLMHQTLNSFFASPLIETIENLPSFQQTVLCVAFRLFRCSESGKRSVDDVCCVYVFVEIEYIIFSRFWNFTLFWFNAVAFHGVHQIVLLKLLTA